MKKLILFILLSLFVLCSLSQDKMYPEGLNTPNTEYYKQMSKNPEFIDVYKKAIEINKDRFSDIDSIQIGDTIYFPNLSNAGIEKIIIKESDAKNGSNCIWNISKKKYQDFLEKSELNEANEFKLNVLSDINNFKSNTNNKKKYVNSNVSPNVNPLVWVMLFIFIFLMIFIKDIFSFIQNTIKKKPLKDKYFVVKNINLLSAEEKIIFFNKYILEGEKIDSIETGVLKRHFGKKYLKIKIWFNAGFHYIMLHEGDRLTKVIVKSRYNNRYSIYFTECGGNLIYPRKNQMTIPANWYFDPDFKKENNEKKDNTNYSLYFIENLSEIDKKRTDLADTAKKKSKKSRAKKEFKELNKIINVLESCHHLDFKINYNDDYGIWKLKLKIKPKKRKKKKKEKK